MLCVVSVPEGIVLCADSSDGNGYGNQDKVFFDKDNNIAFMTYGYADAYNNFKYQFSHKDAYIKEKKFDFKKMTPNKYSPREFAEHLSKNYYNDGFHNNSDRTGIIVAGYEEDEPVLYSYEIDSTERDCIIEDGAFEIPNIRIENGRIQFPSEACKFESFRWKAVIKEILHDKVKVEKEVEVECYKGAFGLVFPFNDTVQEMFGFGTNRYVDFSAMPMEEAESYARYLMKEAIEASTDKSVAGPVDTLILRKNPASGEVSCEWNRMKKENEEENI